MVAESDWKAALEATTVLPPTPGAQVPEIVRRLGAALETGRDDALLSVALEALRKHAFLLAREAINSMRPDSQDFAVAIAKFLELRGSWGTLDLDDVVGWEATVWRHQKNWWGKEQGDRRTSASITCFTVTLRPRSQRGGAK